MSISSKRIDVLDKETNIPSMDLRKLSDNAAYNSIQDALNSALDKVKSGAELLNKFKNGLKALKDAIIAKVQAVLAMIKGIISKILDFLMNNPLTKWLMDIFKFLKNLSLEGLGAFIGRLLGVGKSFLCNNLDFLKMFSLGFALNKNILGGLLTALTLSWLERICKGQSKEAHKAMKPLKKLESVVAPTGKIVDSGNVYVSFMGLFKDYYKFSTPYIPTAMPTNANMIADIKLGKLTQVLSSIRSSEPSIQVKNTLLSDITTELAKHNVYSKEYRYLNNAKGRISTLPLISTERRTNNIKYSNIKDTLGTSLQSLATLDLNNVTTHNKTENEKVMWDTIFNIKSSARANTNLLSRPKYNGSFRDFDFTSILPSMTSYPTGVNNYISNWNGSSNSHRIHDMHPTSTAYLGVY